MTLTLNRGAGALNITANGITAAKAIADGNGANIASTYATIGALNSGLAGKANANTAITGGAFSLSGSSLGLTLNRGAGNISVPAVTLPTGGANSVNVSTSGNNMTVNVDGHSDSATIINSLSASYSGSTLTINVNGRSANTTINASGDRANLTGSLDLSASARAIVDGEYTSQIQERILVSNSSIQTLPGDVSVSGSYVPGIFSGYDSYGYPASTIKYYSYNLNGTGHIIVEATVGDGGGYGLSLDGTWPTIDFSVESGEIISITPKNLYGRVHGEMPLYIHSVRLSL